MWDVLRFEVFFRAVLVGELDRDVTTRSEILEVEGRDAVLFANLVVVGGVDERERQDALLLEVRLVDADEVLREHHGDVSIAGFHGGIFAARTFAVVVVADDDGMDAVVLVPVHDLRGTDGRFPSKAIRGASRSSAAVRGSLSARVAIPVAKTSDPSRPSEVG